MSKNHPSLTSDGQVQFSFIDNTSKSPRRMTNNLPKDTPISDLPSILFNGKNSSDYDIYTNNKLVNKNQTLEELLSFLDDDKPLDLSFETKKKVTFISTEQLSTDNIFDTFYSITSTYFFDPRGEIEDITIDNYFNKVEDKSVHYYIDIMKEFENKTYSYHSSAGLLRYEEQMLFCIFYKLDQNPELKSIILKSIIQHTKFAPLVSMCNEILTQNQSFIQYKKFNLFACALGGFLYTNKSDDGSEINVFKSLYSQYEPSLDVKPADLYSESRSALKLDKKFIDISNHEFEFIDITKKIKIELHKGSFIQIDEKTFGVLKGRDKTKKNTFLAYAPNSDTDVSFTTINDALYKEDETVNIEGDSAQTKTQNIDDSCFISDDDEKLHITVQKLGEGTTSITYKIFDLKSEKTLCKKVLKYDKKRTFKDVQNAIKEFEFLHSVHHPCICYAYGMNPTEAIKDELNHDITTFAIFLEYLEYSLSDCLERQILSNSMKARVVVDICHGMLHIHKLGWIHRDLKIDNIMLSSIFKAKIVDFGLVRFNECLSNEPSSVKKSMSKGVGTMAYMSPEMLNEDEYNEKTDVFSFGIVLFYIFVGKLPEYKMRDRMTAKPISLPEESDSISKFCLDLIARCTSAEPADRPTFEQILNELRVNDYRLASDIDKEFVEKRDKELIPFD